MKRIIFVLFVCFIMMSSYSQIGINTDIPQGIFHIDPLRNTVGISNGNDDIIVLDNGNMGLGTTSPSTRFHIESSAPGAIRIFDTQQAEGLLLSSDTDGNGFWLTSKGSIIQGKPIVESFAVSPDNWTRTKSYIEIPPQTSAVLCCLSHFCMDQAGLVEMELGFGKEAPPFISASTAGKTGKSIQYTGFPNSCLVMTVYIEEVVNSSNTPLTFYLWAKGKHSSPTATLRYTPNNTFNDIRIYGIVY